MQVEQVKPEPVEDVFKVYMSRSEAVRLMRALGNTDAKELWDIDKQCGPGRDLYYALKAAGVRPDA